MDRKRLYRFQQAILCARRVRGISQKALALTSGLDGSRLSAFETGRLIGPASALVERIRASLKLIGAEGDVLVRAGKHDRAMRAIAREIESDRLPLLALTLDATWLLSDEQYASLTTFVQKLVEPQERLAALNQAKETAMT